MTVPITASPRGGASQDLFGRARRLIPGGVNSPVRAFRGVGGSPLFIARAEGARVFDEDGGEYIDYIGSWGPMILGHGHPAVVEAVRRQSGLGFYFGAPTRLEVEMAERIADFVPSIERVRMVNSGTEATMAAVRLARGATGRERRSSSSRGATTATAIPSSSRPGRGRPLSACPTAPA